ncbi:hypothetical protein [Streptomyces sp. NBC_01176]|uniref:hypothetical protein n=1 Tax=Streptomyces sp. NBC_01176 TaxID=2903760 RepID=UPI003868EFF4
MTAGAGRGIARADHFRAGSLTETLVATVVLQLAAEHRLSLSGSVDAHLPRPVRGMCAPRPMSTAVMPSPPA